MFWGISCFIQRTKMYDCAEGCWAVMLRCLLTTRNITLHYTLLVYTRLYRLFLELGKVHQNTGGKVWKLEFDLDRPLKHHLSLCWQLTDRMEPLISEECGCSTQVGVVKVDVVRALLSTPQTPRRPPTVVVEHSPSVVVLSDLHNQHAAFWANWETQKLHPLQTYTPLLLLAVTCALLVLDSLFWCSASNNSFTLSGWYTIKICFNTAES